MSLFREDYHYCCWLRIHTAEDSLFKRCDGIPQIPEIFFSADNKHCQMSCAVLSSQTENTDMFLVFFLYSELLRRMKKFQKVIANCYNQYDIHRPIQ